MRRLNSSMKTEVYPLYNHINFICVWNEMLKYDFRSIIKAGIVSLIFTKFFSNRFFLMFHNGKRMVLIFVLVLMTLNGICTNRIWEKELAVVEEKLYFYPGEGEAKLDSLIKILPESKFNKYAGEINFLKGVLAYKKAEVDSSIFYLERALLDFVNDEDKVYQAKSQLVLGWLAERIGYWDQAKINFYKVIELVDKKNPRELGLAYLGIARCNLYLNKDSNSTLRF